MKSIEKQLLWRRGCFILRKRKLNTVKKFRRRTAYKTVENRAMA
jgi:hypothetical protein